MAPEGHRYKTDRRGHRLAHRGEGGSSPPPSVGMCAREVPCWAGSAPAHGLDIGIPMSGASRAATLLMACRGGAWCVRAHASEAWAMPSTPSPMARWSGRGGDRRLEGGSGGEAGGWMGDRPAGLARIGARGGWGGGGSVEQESRRAAAAGGCPHVRPRVPLGGYLFFPVTTSQTRDMWVEGRHYHPAATPDSGSVTRVTRRTAGPALFPVAKGE